MTRFLPLVLLLACTNPPGGEVPSQTLSLKASGLWLTSNPLDAPDGALAEAKNVVIRRPGVAEKRRGQAPDTTMGGAVDAVTWFDGFGIGHTAANTVERRLNSVTSSAYSGTYVPPSGSPMRFATAGGGLYFTTNTGVKRLDSATSQPVNAGVPPGLEGKGDTTGTSGWLATGMTVGYRVVWGERDEDGDLLVGAPSGRILVTNSAGAGRDVVLTLPIPAGVVQGVTFLQVYRTVNVVSSGNDPGEDMAQVLEYFPNAGELAAGIFSVTDISSFASGPTAYFSPSLGPGLADAHEQPPLMTDMVVFKHYLFGVVQAYQQTKQLTLLAVGGDQGLQGGEGIVVVQGSTREVYEASAAEDPTADPPTFLLDLSSPSPAQNIEDTARSLVRVINEASTLIYATYASSTTELPGKIILRERAVGGAPITVLQRGTSASIIPDLQKDFSAKFPTTRSANVTTISVPAGTAGLKVGQAITAFISWFSPTDQANFPTRTTTIASIPTSTTFTIADPGPDATALFDMGCNCGDASQGLFDQEATSATYAFSNFEEYDAFPPRFRFQVGGPTNVLYRITAQGNALLFWTSEGLYRLTGEDEDSFILRPMDTTYVLAAPNSPTTVRGQAFALTTRGVVAVTDESSTVVSGVIEQELLKYYGSEASKRVLTAASAFAVGYESEGEYVLFLPSLTATPGTPATFAYTFSTKTGTWVGPWEFSWAGINSGTKYVKTGMVGDDGFLYLASSNRLTRERKDRAPSDYQDTTGAAIPSEVTWQVQTASNPGLYKQWVETTMFMEAPQPSSVNVAFTTEIDTTPEGGTIPSLGNLNIRTGIPRDKSRSARLNVSMANDMPQENMSILGLSVIYNAASPKVGR